MNNNPSPRNVVYLDNAATTFPKPESVTEAVIRFMQHVGGNPGRSGHRLARAAQEIIWEARESVARLIGLARPYRLVFTSGTTMSLNIALKGFLKPGDHVVTTALEHNSLLRPLHGLSNRSDVRYSFVECSPEGVLNLEELESVLKHNRTKLIAVVHASNVTGAVLPIRQISAVAARYGVALLVDAAQSVGAFPFSIADWPRIDFLAFSGHKSLLGPQGTGALYVSEEVELEPLCEGGTGSRSESIDQPSLLPDQLESGTANAAGIAGLAASTRFLLSVGVEAVQDHECHLADHLIAGISQIPGIKIYGQGANARTGVVSFTVQGWDPGEVSFVLDEEFAIMSRPGLHCTPFAHRVLGTFPAGTVRLSVGYFNTLQEIEFTIQALEDIASRRRKA